MQAELIRELEALSNWPDSALDAWLEYRDQISRSADESDADYQHRCLEAWTASGARAEAEEEVAGQAALVARRVLDQLSGNRNANTPRHRGNPSMNLWHIGAESDEGHNYDLFVWATTYNQALDQWATYYELTDDGETTADAATLLGASVGRINTTPPETPGPVAWTDLDDWKPSSHA